MPVHDTKNIYDNQFYFRYLNFDNQQELEEELRKVALPIIPETLVDGYFEYPSLTPFFENKIINSFFKEYDLQVLKCATVKAKPWDLHTPHTDGIPLHLFPYALNFNLLNCENTHVKMYAITEKGYKGDLLTTRGYPHYGYDLKKCKEVFRYTLARPILFNARQIHQVSNPSESVRISISFRFASYPRKLLL